MFHYSCDRAFRIFLCHLVLKLMFLGAECLILAGKCWSRKLESDYWLPRVGTCSSLWARLTRQSHLSEILGLVPCSGHLAGVCVPLKGLSLQGQGMLCQSEATWAVMFNPYLCPRLHRHSWQSLASAIGIGPRLAWLSVKLVRYSLRLACLCRCNPCWAVQAVQ